MYGYKIKVKMGFDEAIQKVKEELIKEGFGVLTEIDVTATLKKKLNVDFKKYVILGACHPPSAYLALQAEEDIGLLLPCNIIIYKVQEQTIISAIKPSVAMQMVDNPQLTKISEDIEGKLIQIINNVDDKNE